MPRVIHRKRLFDGKMTAEEVHSKYGFPRHAKCAGCGAPPLIRGIVLMEFAEARKNPMIDQLLLARPEALLEQIVQIKGSDGKPSPYFRVSIAYACKRCAPTMERTLAKAPSHCIVEINRGPGPDKMISSGGMSIH